MGVLKPLGSQNYSIEQRSKNITQKMWPGLSGCVVLRDAGTWQWTWNGAQLSRELSVNQSIALTLAHPPISQLYNSPHLWHVWQFRTEKIVTKQLCRLKREKTHGDVHFLWTATLNMIVQLHIFADQATTFQLSNRCWLPLNVPYVKFIKLLLIPPNSNIHNSKQRALYSMTRIYFLNQLIS